jgi:SSS family solute:Na+ symporter
VLIFLISAATMIGVSYATAPPSEAQIQGLTLATVTPEQKEETRRSWNQWDIINSGVVLALIVMAYIYFSG